MAVGLVAWQRAVVYYMNWNLGPYELHALQSFPIHWLQHLEVQIVLWEFHNSLKFLQLWDIFYVVEKHAIPQKYKWRSAGACIKMIEKSSWPKAGSIQALVTVRWEIKDNLNIVSLKGACSEFFMCCFLLYNETHSPNSIDSKYWVKWFQWY